ncbi:hypothetical protein Peur_064694 [Populus x canadensis]
MLSTSPSFHMWQFCQDVFKISIFDSLLSPNGQPAKVPWKVTANRRDDGSLELGCQHSIWKKNRLAYKLNIFSVQKFI